MPGGGGVRRRRVSQEKQLHQVGLAGSTVNGRTKCGSSLILPFNDIAPVRKRSSNVFFTKSTKGLQEGLFLKYSGGGRSDW